MLDVIHKICHYEGCIRRPSFGIKDGKETHCISHKTTEMVDVIHKICKHNGCNSINPVFDITGGNGSFCNLHKTTGMIDVRNKKCKYKDCIIRPNYGIPLSIK